MTDKCIFCEIFDALYKCKERNESIDINEDENENKNEEYHLLCAHYVIHKSIDNSNHKIISIIKEKELKECCICENKGEYYCNQCPQEYQYMCTVCKNGLYGKHSMLVFLLICKQLTKMQTCLHI